MTDLTRARRGRLETQTQRGHVTTEAEAEEAVTAQGRLQPQQLEEAGGTPRPQSLRRERPCPTSLSDPGIHLPWPALRPHIWGR